MEHIAFLDYDNHIITAIVEGLHYSSGDEESKQNAITKYKLNLKTPVKEVKAFSEDDYFKLFTGECRYENGELIEIPKEENINNKNENEIENNNEILDGEVLAAVSESNNIGANDSNLDTLEIIADLTDKIETLKSLTKKQQDYIQKIEVLTGIKQI